MAEEKKNIPAVINIPPDKVTEGAIVAFFRALLSRKEYHQLLQDIDNLYPTKENLPEVYQSVKLKKKEIADFLELAKEAASGYFKAHRLTLKCANELVDPMLAKLSKVESEIKILNDEVLADLQKQQKEVQRIEGIKNQMTFFINNCTAFISTAISDKQITTIQKRIGTEKSRDSFYQEFMPEFKEKCAALDPLIKERKEYIKKQDELDAAARKATESNDADAASSIKEQQEQLENDMEENILRLQEEAFSQISNDIPVIVPEDTSQALTGRNYWRWEVIDVKKALKKHEDWVNLVPNKEILDKFISENSKQWKEDGKKEVIIDGIKFFIKNYL